MADLGDLIPLGVQVRDEDGEPVNAQTVTLTITKPDGTVQSVPVTNPPADTGEYTINYVPVDEGRYLVRWQTTNPTAAFTDSFDVRDARFSIMSLATAKRHLNMTLENTSEDDELQSMIEAVTSVVERHRGEVVARRVVVEHEPMGSCDRIALMYHPVISVTSIEDERGVSVPTNGWMLDSQNGILTARTAQYSNRSLVVTYIAGYTQIPAHYILAAKIILHHMWQTQRVQNVGLQPTLGSQSRREEQIVSPTGMGYAIPHRAIELLGGRPSVIV